MVVCWPLNPLTCLLREKITEYGRGLEDITGKTYFRLI